MVRSWCRYNKQKIEKKNVTTHITKQVPLINKKPRAVVEQTVLPFVETTVPDETANNKTTVNNSSKRARRDLGVNSNNHHSDFHYGNNSNKKNRNVTTSAKPASSISKQTFNIGSEVHLNTNETKHNVAFCVDMDEDDTLFRTVTESVTTSIQYLQSSVMFGQAEYFYRTHMTNDTLVNGLAFACITSRDTVHDEDRWHYYIDVSGLNGGEYLAKEYVCLNTFYSTAVGLSALDNTSLPIVAEEAKNKFHFDSSGFEHSSYAKSNAALDRIYLLELQPERLKFEYDCIVEDKDGTKVADVYSST